MDDGSFDALTRRASLLTLTGGLAALAGPFAAAKKKRKKKKKTSPCQSNCAGKNCGDDGCGGSCGTCGADQSCQTGTCACVCPTGQLRLSNGTCALACTNNTQCPTYCVCIGANEEGQDLCGIAFAPAQCSEVPQVCDTTADCPRGQHCLVTTCGQGGSNENRCLPLCAV